MYIIAKQTPRIKTSLRLFTIQTWGEKRTCAASPSPLFLAHIKSLTKERNDRFYLDYNTILAFLLFTTQLSSLSSWLKVHFPSLLYYFHRPPKGFLVNRDKGWSFILHSVSACSSVRSFQFRISVIRAFERARVSSKWVFTCGFNNYYRDSKNISGWTCGLFSFCVHLLLKGIFCVRD